MRVDVLDRPAMRSPRQLPTQGDGPLPDLTSGAMWLATAAAGLGALALPGADHSHLSLVIGLAAFATAWGGFSLWMGLNGHTMSIGLRAMVTAAMMPIVGLALWATGGEDSFLQPVLLFTALFIGYFFEPRYAWPLLALFVAAYAAPLVYDESVISTSYPSRTLTFAVGVVGAAVAVHHLKRRLVLAEARQRTMAQRDPLTGLRNRRAFDHVLAREVERCALVVFDFDGFKSINDTHGHPVGDAVLRAVAEACEDVVREADCLARIGGDEFALIAPGAGAAGVERIIAALGEAVDDALMPEGVDSVSATFAWAVAPYDTLDPHELFRLADARLLERKRHGRRGLTAVA
jgi:diguanylate cyclase (GGDEF)-like protein